MILILVTKTVGAFFPLLFLISEVTGLQVRNATALDDIVPLKEHIQEKDFAKASERGPIISESYVHIPSIGDSISFTFLESSPDIISPFTVISPDFDSYLWVSCMFRLGGGSSFTIQSRGTVFFSLRCPSKYLYCTRILAIIPQVYGLTFTVNADNYELYKYNALMCRVEAVPPEETTTSSTTTTSTTTTPTTTTPTTTTSTTTSSTTTTSRPSGPTILNTCECGKQLDTRIVGGVEAPDNKYPFAAKLTVSGNLRCGGTLVSDEFVLTAAHCTRGFSPSEISVLLAANNATQSEGLTFGVLEIIEHPEYSNFFTIRNDISLLRLSSPVDFSSNGRIRPTCLPEGSNSYEGTNVTAIGWGRLSTGGPIPENLMEVVVPVVSNKDCANAYSIITPSIICAGQEGKASCNGDSGGSLLHQNPGNYYETIGVTSFRSSEGCGAAGYPVGYTRVTAYMPWIIGHIKDSSTCRIPN